MSFGVPDDDLVGRSECGRHVAALFFVADDPVELVVEGM
jgi:hypothetical protein